MGSILDRLRSLSQGLELWFWRIRKERKLNTADLRKRLQDFNDAFPSENTLGEIMEVKLALNLEADKDELYWEQRARANWLRSGHRNTGFFHRYASHHRQRNKIHSMCDSAGNVVDTTKDVLQIASSYFQDLFSTEGIADTYAILSGVDMCVSSMINQELLKDFSVEGVFQAVRSMGPLKASGDDGLGDVFYKRFWHIIGADVAEFCIDLLQAFNDEDVASILSIRLSTTMERDVLSWAGELSGHYSVRSGYRLLLSSSGLLVQRAPIFHSLWSTSCPLKIKILVLKCYWNYIPTMENLCTKKIVHSPLRPRCHASTESISHASYGCVFAQHIWLSLNYQCPLSVLDLNFPDWLQWMFDNFNFDRHSEILFTIWALWFARNKLVHENKHHNLSELLGFIRGYISELRSSTSSLIHPNVRIGARWLPPYDPHVKINIDASFLHAECKSFSGIVVQDSAWLQFGEEIGCREVLVEGESRSVMQKLTSSVADVSILHPIIATVKALACRFRSCRFLFAGRNNNKASHAMARVGCLESVDGFWIENATPNILSAMAVDRRWIDPP
ncbi:hypothetical protein GQ457_13G021040 [Hibiscus cannabinus]